MTPGPIHAAHWASEDLLENQQPGKGWFALKKRAVVLGELWCRQHFVRVYEAQGYLSARIKCTYPLWQPMRGGFLQTDPSQQTLSSDHPQRAFRPKEQTQQHPAVL